MTLYQMVYLKSNLVGLRIITTNLLTFVNANIP